MADLEPVRGSEADKRRPAVLVSNDAANQRAESLGARVGRLPPETMEELDRALRLHLAL